MKWPSLALAAVIAVLFVSPVVCLAVAQPDQVECAVLQPGDGFAIDSKGFAAALPEVSEQPESDSLTVSHESQPKPKGMWAGNPGKFFEGAFVGLVGHEGGHYVANWAVGSSPYLKSVHYGPVPFFTIEPGRGLDKREHYITASAGFNSQHIINEWLLTTHPNLSKEDEPFLKGVAAFDFWLTVGYAATAFAGTGPNERDTKGMADSLGWNERYVGAMILVPTALDTYRYKHPDAKWAKTASRVSKLAMFLLAFTIDD